jgi:predicted transcriptional regulator
MSGSRVTVRLRSFATRLPDDLAKTLDEVCRLTGLRRSFVVEMALREKIEDLLDAADLRQAMEETTGFHRWEEVKKTARVPRPHGLRRRA